MIQSPLLSLLSTFPADRLRDRRVVVRMDLDVPRRADGSITTVGEWRLRKGLPTIRLLQRAGARSVILGHWDRPGGVVDEEWRLRPVGERLSSLLQHSVKALALSQGVEVDTAIQALGPGEVILLENTRFERGEEKNARSLATAWAAFGDLYINDAFAGSHREHASIVGVPHILPSAAGLQLEAEITALNTILHEPPRPFVLFMGGAKTKTKLPLLRQLVRHADTVVVGGVVANTILTQRGYAVGRSVVDDDELPSDILHNETIVTPLDVVVAPAVDATESRVCTVDAVTEEDVIVDIGPETQQYVHSIIEEAATVVWNGPMGYFENILFMNGTRSLAEAMARSSAMTIAGGGESVAVLNMIGVLDRLTHVSTGGGAMLTYLLHGTLPGIEALRQTPF